MATRSPRPMPRAFSWPAASAIWRRSPPWVSVARSGAEIAGASSRPLAIRSTIASDNADLDVADALDVAAQHITAVDGTYARGRSRKDDVARHQREQARQIADHLRYLPDHLIQVASLLALAIDVQPNRALVGMPDSACRHQRRARPRRLERLSDLPWAAHVLCLALQVAPGHVEGDAIAVNAIQRLFDRNVGATALQRHDHLDLVMDVVGRRRIGKLAAGIEIVR